MPDSPVAEGQILAGKYRVERVLGSGGMGFVVAAWHLELEQRVAMKFLHPLAFERADGAERFRREARSAAKIRSEHVARVIDVGVMEGGLPYMVMEYLHGHDVSDEMAKVGKLPIEDAVDFVLQAIEAVAEAHAAGIVHRDLKPANLFVATRPDGSRIIKVLDFGISKSLLTGSAPELSLTRTSALIGSPLYMSPEQMRSAKDVDTRTDIWSLGVILYEMITGQPPYTGDSVPALCASLLSDTPPPMRTLRPEVAPELEATILRCLAKNREQRFRTVAELASALAPFGRSTSQLHVDRAGRVLGLRASNLSGSGDSGTSTSLAPVDGHPPAQAAPAGRGTADSWGRTDAALRNGSPAGRSKSRVALLVGLAFGSAALLGAVLFAGMRRASPPPTASASVAAPSPTMLSTAESPHPGDPATKASAPLVLPSAQAPDPATLASAAIKAPEPTVKPLEPTVKPLDPATKPKLVQPRPLQFKPKPNTSAKPVTTSGVSDFGGRR